MLFYGFYRKQGALAARERFSYRVFNSQAPVAQKTADEMVFDVSKVKESSFFKIGPH